MTDRDANVTTGVGEELYLSDEVREVYSATDVTTTVGEAAYLSDFTRVVDYNITASFVDTNPPSNVTPSLQSATAESLTIQWGASTDDTTAPADIVYEVFVVPDGDAFDYDQPYKVTPPGATVTTVQGLDPDTDYDVVVLARDLASNRSGAVIVGMSTNDVGAADSDAPVIDNFSPPPGTTLAPSAALSFDVTDDVAFRRIIVTVTQQADGIEEVAHDGNSFRGLFQTTSVRTLIAGGWHYSLRRLGGWTSAPIVKVFAVDTSGNETTS